MAATWTAPVDRSDGYVVGSTLWNQLFGTNGSLKYLYDQGTLGGLRADFRAQRHILGLFTVANTAAVQGLAVTTFIASSGGNALQDGEPAFQCGTAAGAAGSSGVAFQGAQAYVRPDKSPRMLFRMLPPPSSANLTYLNAGFIDNPSATATGAYLRIVTTGNIVSVTRQGGSETTTYSATRPSVITGYEVETADAGVTWVFRDETGTVLATHTTNVPTAATGLKALVYATTATSDLTWFISYFQLEGTF